MAAAGGKLDGVTQEVSYSVTDFSTMGETFSLVACQKTRVVHVISLTTVKQRRTDGSQKGSVERKESLLVKGWQASWAAACRARKPA